jgi:hypothetical protein
VVGDSRGLVLTRLIRAPVTQLRACSKPLLMLGTRLLDCPLCRNVRQPGAGQHGDAAAGDPVLDRGGERDVHRCALGLLVGEAPGTGDLGQFEEALEDLLLDEHCAS